MRNKWGNYATNLNFKHVIDSTGKEITADLDYARYDADNSMKYRTSKFDTQNILRETRNEDGLTGSRINIYSLKVDLIYPINKTSKFEAGLKSSYVNSNNDMRFDFLVGDNNTPVLDPTRTRDFVYKENINAAYINYSKEFKKADYAVGLTHGKYQWTRDFIRQRFNRQTLYQLFSKCIFPSKTRQKSSIGIFIQSSYRPTKL
jgi:hypothetical protein